MVVAVLCCEGCFSWDAQAWKWTARWIVPNTKTGQSEKKICSSRQETHDCGKGSPSYKTMILSIRRPQCQNLDLNPFKNLWWGIKIAVHQNPIWQRAWSPSNMTGYIRIQMYYNSQLLLPREVKRMHPANVCLITVCFTNAFLSDQMGKEFHLWIPGCYARHYTQSFQRNRMFWMSVLHQLHKQIASEAVGDVWNI